MEGELLSLEVVTPEGQVIAIDTDSVVAPGAEGYLGILPKHAPLITSLAIGVVRFKTDGEEKRMAVSGGFMEVANDRVVILANTAELADNIDVGRAEESRRRAEERLREKQADLDLMRAELSLQRAIARLKAAGRLED